MPKIFLASLLFAAVSAAQIVQPGTGGGTSSAGAQVLLGTFAVSASGELDVTTRTASGQSGAIFQSDYDEYRVVLLGITPSTTGLTLNLQVSTNGGTSYDTGSNYSTSQVSYSTGGTGGSGPGTGTSILLGPYSGRTLVNTAGKHQSGSFSVFKPAGFQPAFSGTFLSVDSVQSVPPQGLGVTGQYLSTTDITAFRIQTLASGVASGAFSGSVRIYGISK